MFQLNFLGIFDSLRNNGGALKHYKQKLHEYQEHEAEVLIDIGVIYLDRGEPQKAAKNFEAALENYRKLNFPEGIAYASELLGDSFMVMRDFERALSCYSDVLSIYSEIRSPLADDIREKIYEAGKIREAISSIEDENESEDSAEDKLAMEVSSEAETLFRLSDELLEFVDGFETYRDAWSCRDMDFLRDNLESAAVIGDGSSGAVLNLLTGKHELEEGGIDDALRFIKRSSRLFKETGDMKGLAVSRVITGIVLFIMDERENLYRVFKEALATFRSLELDDAERVTMKIINTLSRM